MEGFHSVEDGPDFEVLLEFLAPADEHFEQVGTSDVELAFFDVLVAEGFDFVFLFPFDLILCVFFHFFAVFLLFLG